MTELTKEVVNKLWGLMTNGLREGLGSGRPGDMCVQQATSVVFSAGPSGIVPSVCGTDAHVVRRLNDLQWSTDKLRGQALMAVAVMQLGTAGTDRGPWVKELAANLQRIVDNRSSIECAKLPCPDMPHIQARCGHLKRSVLTAREAILLAQVGRPGPTWSAKDKALLTVLHLSAAYHDDAEQTRVFLEMTRAVEEAYEATGSPGLDLLRSIESVGI